MKKLILIASFIGLSISIIAHERTIGLKSFHGLSNFSSPVSFKSKPKEACYTVRRLNGTIDIDANWNKPQWQKAKTLDIGYYMGKVPEYQSKVRAKLMYDADNLYVIFKVTDKNIRSKIREINGPVWEDNCVELFFAPDSAEPLKYYNLEINCVGVPLMNYNAEAKTDITPLSVDDIKKIKIAHSLESDPDIELEGPLTWTLEYRLPFSVLEKYSNVTIPAKGVIWNANLYKIAHKSTNPHYMSWSRVGVEGIDMHTPQFFGKLKFQ